MEKKSWLIPIAALTLAAFSYTNPATAREINQEVESIEIYVPPPENWDNTNNNACSSSLEALIDPIINRPTFAKARWGILIESLDGNTTYYAHNANRLLIPASNVKIFTTAAILQRLSPNTEIRTKSLTEWVKVTNLRSNNSYANFLIRYIGGPARAKELLNQLGVEPGGYRLVDGSGLSRSNAATPRAIVQVLRGMMSSPAKDTFLSSLPVAGESGTLKGRMRNSSVQGIVHAKTGTLTGVRALSGYMNHNRYGTLVFSIIVNQPNQSGATLVRAVDEIVTKVNRFSMCP